MSAEVNKKHQQSSMVEVHQVFEVPNEVTANVTSQTERKPGVAKPASGNWN